MFFINRKIPENAAIRAKAQEAHNACRMRKDLEAGGGGRETYLGGRGGFRGYSDRWDSQHTPEEKQFVGEICRGVGRQQLGEGGS